jgi:hypothetical protein
MSLWRYVRCAVLIVLSAVTVQLGLLASNAQAEPPPPPPSVTLEAEHTSVKVSETIHLTATAAENVGPTPYTIRIFDADTHSQVASCGTGTTCTASITVAWAENETVPTHHYYAEVNGGSEGLYTRSGEVAVAVEHYVFSVSISASPSTVTIPESYTLKATSSANVGPTPYSIRIIENGANHEVATCGTGTECSTTIASSYSENSSVHLHTFHAVVADSTYTAGTSGNASAAVLPFFFTVSLSLTFDHNEEKEGHIVTFDKAVATTDRNVGPTPYWIVIRKDGEVFTRCGSGTECTATVEAGHSYTASVEDGEGHNFGGSSVEGIPVASLAALYASGEDLCNTLLTYPGTHYFEETPTDQWVACDTAESAGATLPQIISRVAGTAGGAGVLWWALHEGTLKQPGFELPAPSEADPYPVPTTLPEAWPLERVTAEIEAKNKAVSEERTKEQIEDVARRCLWYMSIVPKDGNLCSSLPIFVSGSDVAAATLHDLKALAVEPGFVRQNYESAEAKKEKVSNRKWYEGVGACAAERPVGDQCDEFPLWATQQGGPPSPPTSLEYINAVDNEAQGSLYGNFVTICKMAERSETNYAFLWVPVPPSLGVPTIKNLCN